MRVKWRLCNFFAGIKYLHHKTCVLRAKNEIKDSNYSDLQVPTSTESSNCTDAYLNPYNWSKRTIKVFFSLFFMITLPLYLLIGFQPALPVDALDYPHLDIPSINLQTPVAPLELKNHELETPATIAGAYSQNSNKILIIGHSSTVFQQLENVQLGQVLTYDKKLYQISHIETQAKSEISMRDVLAGAPQETIIIMTCAGTPLPNQDATHRLMVTAIRIQE